MKLTLLKSLTTIGLGLFLGSVFTNSVQAEISNSLETTAEFQPSVLQPLLLSQLQGHDVYMGEPQIEWDNLMLGHVAGKVGNIGSIVLPDGTSFRSNVTVHPGDDVLVEQDDNGNYSVVQPAHSRWISILESEYGWKRLDMSAYQPLSERTAALWAQLDSRPMTTTEVTPRATTPSTYTPPPVESEPEPVRGLW
jgi:hypothetical protein